MKRRKFIFGAFAAMLGGATSATGEGKMLAVTAVQNRLRYHQIKDSGVVDWKAIFSRIDIPNPEAENDGPEE